MQRFRVFRIYKEDSRISARVELANIDDLSAGEVVIKAEFSSVNYKDALAANGPARIVTKFPLIGGVDVSGRVESSEDERYKVGDKVLVTGYNMSISHDGGYAEYVRVPAEWVIPLPETLSLREAMVLGTAGFTAALCIHRMEQNGQTPDLGSILVTGATGGVGSIAIDMLSAKGYQVTALTGKPNESDYLRELGADHVLDRRSLELTDQPIEKALWAGAIDNVGGDLLSWLTKTVKPWGNICSVGLAGGTKLETSVMPFILRGVSLLGITSAGCPTELRQKIWDRIATDLRPNKFEQMAITEIGLDDINATFKAMLNGETKGRTVVRL